MAALFTDKFSASLRSLIGQHHSLYPRIPPQGIFFESLVERAFLRAGWKPDQVVLTTPNSPQHDLLVGHAKISVKSETGKSTSPRQIKITKLCTTETGSWASTALIQHAISHLARYEHILMLRAIWPKRKDNIHYQLVDIPLDLLRLMTGALAVEVGKRPGRRSLAVDVVDRGATVFRVHFDGADGKCQIHKLLVSRCNMLAEWDWPLAIIRT